MNAFESMNAVDTAKLYKDELYPVINRPMPDAKVPDLFRIMATFIAKVMRPTQLHKCSTFCLSATRLKGRNTKLCERKYPDLSKKSETAKFLTPSRQKTSNLNQIISSFS